MRGSGSRRWSRRSGLSIRAVYPGCLSGLGYPAGCRPRGSARWRCRRHRSGCLPHRLRSRWIRPPTAIAIPAVSTQAKRVSRERIRATPPRQESGAPSGIAHCRSDACLPRAPCPLSGVQCRPDYMRDRHPVVPPGARSMNRTGRTSSKGRPHGGTAGTRLRAIRRDAPRILPGPPQVGDARSVAACGAG